MTEKRLTGIGKLKLLEFWLACGKNADTWNMRHMLADAEQLLQVNSASYILPGKLSASGHPVEINYEQEDIKNV